MILDSYSFFDTSLRLKNIDLKPQKQTTLSRPYGNRINHFVVFDMRMLIKRNILIRPTGYHPPIITNCRVKSLQRIYPVQNTLQELYCLLFSGSTHFLSPYPCACCLHIIPSARKVGDVGWVEKTKTFHSQNVATGKMPVVLLSRKDGGSPLLD